MSQYKIEKQLDPYERKVLKLLQDNEPMKFGHIIMRLGLSANHGQRVLNALLNKELVVHDGSSRYMSYE